MPQRVRDLYQLLRSHFGYADSWWPGSPLEIVLAAILVQRCNWTAAWKAVGQLRENELLSLARLGTARLDQVRECLTSVAFAATKAGRLIQLAKDIQDRGHATVEEFLAPSRGTENVRRVLLSLEGVGRETADAILLFASEHPVFVVDEYTRRIFRRVRLSAEYDDLWSGPYETVRACLEQWILPHLSLYGEFPFAPGVPRAVALLRDWHADVVELGKHHCLKTNPRCQEPGGPCWDNFETGISHCQPPACQRCPLSQACGFARLGGAGNGS
jgi:endonuclease-3 related protein